MSLSLNKTMSGLADLTTSELIEDFVVNKKLPVFGVGLTPLNTILYLTQIDGHTRTFNCPRIINIIYY